MKAIGIRVKNMTRLIKKTRHVTSEFLQDPAKYETTKKQTKAPGRGSFLPSSPQGLHGQAQRSNPTINSLSTDQEEIKCQT